MEQGSNTSNNIMPDMSMNAKDSQEHCLTAKPELLLASKCSFEEMKRKVEINEQSLEELFKKVFQIYKAEEVVLSFNGGKDSTVVLHMLNRFFQKDHNLNRLKILTLFITDPDGFSEIDEFVNDCSKLYNIEMIKMEGTIKEALERMCIERPLTKAVFMGSRRTDPHCQDLKAMQQTDPGWPPLMRINPILDWTCRDVWQYIYVYDVPYCILYQKGFTSIGNKKNTKPNPYLRVIESTTGHVLDYRPAHELLDNDNLERAGRI
uniref:FAD synthase n=1 Tax=Glossina brevipalpis TaxID=37001 RepID=A0A1A9WTY7_9MUSC